MPKVIFVFSVIFLTLLSTLFVRPSSALAANPTPCSQKGITIKPVQRLYGTNEPIELELSFEQQAASLLHPNKDYDVAFILEDFGAVAQPIANPLPSSTNSFKGDINNLPDRLTLQSGLNHQGLYTLEFRARGSVTHDSICTIYKAIDIRPAKFNQLSCQMNLPKNIQYNTDYRTSVQVSDLPGLQYNLQIFTGTRPTKDFSLRTDNYWPTDAIRIIPIDPKNATAEVLSGLNIGNYTAVIEVCDGRCMFGRELRTSDISVAGCVINHFSVTQLPTSSEFDTSKSPESVGKEQAERQQQTGLTGEPISAAGQACDSGSGGVGTGGIATAIGCIPTEPKTFVEAVLRFAAGAGGGIALLLMVAGAFRMITSAGNPEAIKKGGEQFTSAIIGLLFILFSVLLLKFIGVDILGLGAYLGY